MYLKAKGLLEHESFSTPWGEYSRGAAITELLGSVHCTIVGQVNFSYLSHGRTFQNP